MKKFFLCIPFLFIYFSTFCKDFKDIDQLYGIKEFFKSDEEKLLSVLYKEKKFYKTLFDINDNKTGFNEIAKFYQYLDLNTLLGNTILDSLILYIQSNHASELVDSINYNKNPDLEIILKTKLFPDKYAKSIHTVSVFPQRYTFGKTISIIIPKINWEPVVNKETDIRIVGGDDNSAILFIYKKEKIKNENEIFNQELVKSKTTLYKQSVDVNKDISLQKDKITEIEPGKLKLIKEKYTIGNKSINKIYEQITVSPKEYNFQSLFQRTRYYLTDDSIITLRIQNIIYEKHPLLDRERIVRIEGMLLDTVDFL